MLTPGPLSRLAAAVALASALGACGDADDVASSPPGGPGATTTTSQVQGTVACDAPARGYRLEYPRAWVTNAGDVAEPCRFFHPEPFTVAPQTDATGIAVSVRLNPVEFDNIVPPLDGSPAADVVDRRTTTIDGRPAARTETIATGGALLPSGTRAVTWYVDATDGTLVASTSEAAAAGRYEDNVDVLDAMMRSLRISEKTASCSTGRTTPAPTPQRDLPAPVSTMRTAVIEAARACDYAELAELALAGDGTFTYSFGGSGSPGDFWREGEAEGRAPLRSLVEILDGPYGSRTAGGTTQYVWPAAYAYDRWQDVPAAALEDLRRLYGDDDLRGFQEFGSYVGDRAGITEDGDWIFFVGGD